MEAACGRHLEAWADVYFGRTLEIDGKALRRMLWEDSDRYGKISQGGEPYAQTD